MKGPATGSRSATSAARATCKAQVSWEYLERVVIDGERKNRPVPARAASCAPANLTAVHKSHRPCPGRYECYSHQTHCPDGGLWVQFLPGPEIRRTCPTMGKASADQLRSCSLHGHRSLSCYDQLPPVDEVNDTIAQPQSHARILACYC